MESKTKPTFWEGIEAEIGDSIPELIKIVLEKCGFNSRLSLCDISLEDIIRIEKHATLHLKQELKFPLKNQPGYGDMKISNEEPFCFLPGHRRIIKQIGSIIVMNQVEVTAPSISKNQSLQTVPQVVPQAVPHKKAIELKQLLCANVVNWVLNKMKDKTIENAIKEDQIRSFGTYFDRRGICIKCQFECPSENCGKKIWCIYRKYQRKSKKRNVDEPKDELIKFTPERWYFTNLKTHILTHQTLQPAESDTENSHDGSNQREGFGRDSMESVFQDDIVANEADSNESNASGSQSGADEHEHMESMYVDVINRSKVTHNYEVLQNSCNKDLAPMTAPVLQIKSPVRETETLFSQSKMSTPIRQPSQGAVKNLVDMFSGK